MSVYVLTIVPMFRNTICWLMIALSPALFAQDTGAMLHGNGPVSLNGKPMTSSSAVFPGDLIQTTAESLATLDATGSSIVVYPNSLVKFGQNSVVLEQGVLSLGTSQGMVGQASAVTVTPASTKWTEFEITDTDGAVQVVGKKGDASVNCGKNTTSMSAGEEVIADPSGQCKKKKRSGGAPTAGKGSLLRDPYVQAGAVGGAGVVICLLLCEPSKPFVSQWKP
jgi:hypothetical protein